MDARARANLRRWFARRESLLMDAAHATTRQRDRLVLVGRAEECAALRALLAPRLSNLARTALSGAAGHGVLAEAMKGVRR